VHGVAGPVLHCATPMALLRHELASALRIVKCGCSSQSQLSLRSILGLDWT
jgi:hypothetical protein